MKWEIHPDLAMTSAVAAAGDRSPISADDAARQEATCREILRRFDEQPGVVLADEVGMGKTFVALAVAASVVRADKYRRQAVVMVPPAVANKWVADFRDLQTRYLPADQRLRAVMEPVRSAVDFLKLLDDPSERRAHVVVMTHGAFGRALQDPLVQLAVVKRALRSPKLAAYRERIPQVARDLLGQPWMKYELVSALLAAPVHRWRGLVESSRGVPLDDDPVPQALLGALDSGALHGQVELVRREIQQLPLRWSVNYSDRVKKVRGGIKTAITELWKVALGSMSFQLPLLVLDEAHHTKNQNNLSSLFSPEVDLEGLDGTLFGKFERMLFLTATPFELGHRELLSVLSRFDAVRMKNKERSEFRLQQERLVEALDAWQRSSTQLDAVWGRLPAMALDGMPEGWWRSAPSDLPDHLQAAGRAVVSARSSFGVAQKQLHPWVVRHFRTPNRLVRSGKAVLPEHDSDPSPVGGLEIPDRSVLPFLLATRAEAVVGQHGLRHKGVGRAVFAEGLASSYDAYFRQEREEEPPAPADVTEDRAGYKEVVWYLEQIRAQIPDGDPDRLDSHPKVAATTERVIDLWRGGEKVLVFCHYRATGRALQRSVSSALSREVREAAISKGLPDADVDRWFGSVLDLDRPAYRAVESMVQELCEGSLISPDLIDRLAAVVVRFLRTPTYAVRYLDLGRDARAAVELAASVDGTSFGLRNQIAAVVQDLDRMTPEQQVELLDHLDGVQTGELTIDADELVGGQRVKVLPTVRLANGGVRREVRERLMATFNTPFFPEVLIASSVMAEGVSLHRSCRHVIHHDLDWNPSTIEQRTGRLDRIGSLSERAGSPVVVYQPYIGGTQDERLFRVVTDRSAWFRVVMGNAAPDELWQLGEMPDRVPLPPDLAAALTFDLSVWPAASS